MDNSTSPIDLSPAIQSSLYSNETLELLSLDEDNLTIQKGFFENVFKNKKSIISKMYFRENKFRDETILELVNVLKCNPQVRYVDIRESQVTEKLREQILEMNKSLILKRIEIWVLYIKSKETICI